MRLAVPLALLLASAAPLRAWDYVEAGGKLSDEDFYHLVSCRALPGGPCAEPQVRWPAAAEGVTIAFAPVSPDYPRPLAQEMARALRHVVAEINGAGAAIRLIPVAKTDPAQIRIHLAPLRAGDTITGIGRQGVDGTVIEAALVTVWWDDRFNLTEAVIVMTRDLPIDEAVPVLLEEVTQALGFLTDIRDAAYEGSSVFSEDSNSVRHLGPQDIAALRRHYGPN